MKNSLEILYPPITVVKSSPHAARQHNQQQRRKLKSLLTKFGQVTPIIVDEGYVIVDGHAVYETLVELGYGEIAVVVVANRTEAEVRALRLALNRISRDAKWDDAKLRVEFEDLISLGFDLELTGFETVEIDMALSIDVANTNTVEEVAIEDIEPSDGPVVTKVGDIWRLDRHLIFCGDARDPDRLRTLAGDSRVTVIFTDPPYNVRIGGNVSGLGKVRHREFAMASGEMDRNAFVAFLANFLAALKPTLIDGAILYVCMDWRHTIELLEAATRQKLELKNLCVWVKSNAGMGSFYRSQHELVFVFKHGNDRHQNNFGLGEHGRSRSNVWQYRGVNAFGKDRAELLGSHPTAKPVIMIADALRDVSRRGDLVLDPFLGSGSTLIAAEETGRICIGIDIDPAYVDVAIRRWQKRTGKDAVNAATGMTFDAVAECATAVTTDSDAAPRSLPPSLDQTSIAHAGSNEEGDNV